MILLMEKIPACRQAFAIRLGGKKNAIAAFSKCGYRQIQKKDKGL